MARYIDAVKTAEIISEKLNVPLGDLVDIFAEIPTAEVVEAKQGYWKLCEDDSLICATEFVCSVCGESFCSSELTDKQMLEMMKYCSNCSADMTRTPKERGGEK